MPGLDKSPSREAEHWRSDRVKFPNRYAAAATDVPRLECVSYLPGEFCVREMKTQRCQYFAM
jgi:hypothetical protein